MKTLLLIDAHALIHRAFHALPPLTSPDGKPVGALYGLARTLLKLLKTGKYDHVAAAFDRPEPTFRKEIFEEYKAQRPPAPSELISQLVASRDLFRAFGIPVFERAGAEADDLIGSVIECLRHRKDLRVVVLSGDLDALQLVRGSRVVVETFKKGISETVTYDETAVKARYGLSPVQLPDYKGLVGDPSDNIKGVRGVGPKTATEVLHEFGNIETLYREMPKNHPLAKKFLPYREDALFAKKLTTIDRHVPIEFKLEESAFRGPDEGRLGEYFASVGFQSLAGGRNTMKHAPEKGREPAPTLPLHRGEVIFFEDATSARGDLEALTSNVLKVAYDWKPIIKELHARNFEVRGPLFDLKVAGWLLDPDYKDVSRESLAARFLGKGGGGEGNLNQTLYRALSGKLAEEGLLKVFQEIEMPLIRVLALMETWGIRVNKRALEELMKDIGRELEKLAGGIYREAGAAFNINSPRQVANILFKKLELRAGRLRKTATGQRRTGKDVLEELAEEHPIVPLILQYREHFKVLSSFVEPLIAAIESDGRVHTTFLQTGTATGRLSSEKPNLQNIPQESRWAEQVRNAFEANPGWSLVSFDYSQLELRLLAHVSADQDLRSAFREGTDIHNLTASRVFDVPLDRVSPPMRRVAKTLNFGVIYGMGARAFSRESKLALKEAERFIREYYDHFPAVRTWQERVKEETRAQGYVENENGRRRWFPKAREEGTAAGEFERAAVNMPLQSLGADILKKAMIQSFGFLEEQKKLDRGAKLLLSIHDELLFVVRDGIVGEIAPALRRLMEGAHELKVPLKVDVKWGKRWGAMMPL